MWPLVKVFLQFSREVQGGSVHRLVFRSPSEYTPEPQVFRPAPVSRRPRDPIVAHIAHDELFVVVVTEIGPKRPIVAEDDEATEGIAEFCDTVKDFLNTQQTAFLAGLNKPKILNTGGMGSNGGDPEFHAWVTEEGHNGAGSSREGSAGASDRPVVTVNQTRLGEFIAKTQTMLQL